MLRFGKFLAEGMTALRPAELAKPNSKTKVSRKEILRQAIVDGTSIDLIDGSKVIFVNSPQNLQAVDNFNPDSPEAFELATTSGKIVSTSKIGKSAIFGGGGGAGGGTENTEIVESAQCVWIQAMLENGHQNDISYFTDEVLTAAFKSVEVGKTSIKQILSIDDTWKNSSYLTAQFLIKNGYVKKSMTFHRDSNVMKAIYKAKDAAIKNSGYKSKFTDDKWNPGDIWAADRSFNPRDLPTDSVKSLNDFILESYKNRTLVGISLKKVNKNLKYSEMNVEQGAVSSYKVMGVGLESARGSFWTTKNGFIQFDGGILMIKDNAYLASNKVEIKGKTARGGGAGWGIIQDFSTISLRKKLPDHKIIKMTAKRAAKGDKRALGIVWALTQKLYPNMSEEQFNTEISKKDAGWISAKLAALYLTTIVQSNMGTKANNFITKLVNYAGSKTEESSAYLKVYE